MKTVDHIGVQEVVDKCGVTWRYVQIFCAKGQRKGTKEEKHQLMPEESKLEGNTV